MPSAALFVSNQGNNTISVYTRPVIGAPAPVTIVTNGVSLPTRLAMDGAGDLFAGEFTSNDVTEWAPPYNGTPTSFGFGAVNGPQWIAITPNGQVVVTNYNGTTDDVFAPPYGASSTPVATLQSGSTPQSLAVDSAGDIFSGSFGANTVEVFAPPPFGGSVTPVANLVNPAGSSLLHPWGIAIDAGGDAWVAWEQSGGTAPISVAEYMPPFSGPTTPSVILTSGISDPEAIAVVTTAGATQGDVFVANYRTNNVVMYAPGAGGFASAGHPLPEAFGGGSPAVLPGTNSGPQALYLDPQANLYVANADNNTVNVYVPPYTSAGNPVATISAGISGPFAFASFP